MKKDENIKEMIRRHERQVKELQTQLSLAREPRCGSEAHRTSRKVGSAGPARTQTVSLRRR